MNRISASRIVPLCALSRPHLKAPMCLHNPAFRCYSDKKPSNYTSFYKLFGRPIAKVVLMAIFTYQLAYYAWVRLEHNEIKAHMTATIAELEARVEKLEAAKLKKT